MLTLNYFLQFSPSIAWKPWIQALRGARCCTDTQPGGDPAPQSSQRNQKKGFLRKVGFFGCVCQSYVVPQHKTLTTIRYLLQDAH